MTKCPVSEIISWFSGPGCCHNGRHCDGRYDRFRQRMSSMRGPLCRLSNNFSRLTYKFSRVFEPLKAENRPVPTHIFSVQHAAPFSHNQGCANSPFHNETKIYGPGHNTIRKAHLHDDMKNYETETDAIAPFSSEAAGHKKWSHAAPKSYVAGPTQRQ